MDRSADDIRYVQQCSLSVNNRPAFCKTGRYRSQAHLVSRHAATGGLSADSCFLLTFGSWPRVRAHPPKCGLFDLRPGFYDNLRMANSFGQLFRITTWGESHGGGVGVVVDGCPPRLELTEADIQPDLDRRRPGQSKIVSPRKEAEKVQNLSGNFEGKTLHTPISMMVRNEDMRPEAYTEMATKFRPSHADYTYVAKFGIRNWQGGGRTSARETIGRVAAGAIAKKILRERYGVEVLAYVKQVQKIIADVDQDSVKMKDVEANIVRCPDADT